MLDSLQTFAAAREARLESLPAQFATQSPVREAVLEGWRQRNAFLDFLFYDVGCVTQAEARSIAPRWAAEGAILQVGPSGGPPLTLCTSLEAFLDCGGAAVRTLVVAGVGSSALGAAAFARNVADATGAPVAAVVSGYGLADLASEALGGFFLFGASNLTRHLFEGLDRATEPATVAEPDETLSEGHALARGKDTAMVMALLKHPDLRFDLVSGHSKGNLVISEGLYVLADEDPALAERLGDQVRLVTVSARVAMPSAFGRVVDVMGSMDVLGAINSRLGLDTEHVVFGAGHHTNTQLWGCLPVTQTFREVLRASAIPAAA